MPERRICPVCGRTLRLVGGELPPHANLAMVPCTGGSDG